MTEALLKAIEQTLGLVALRVVLAALAVYIVWEAVLRLWQSIRRFSSERGRLEREKSLLEVLKLRCEIETLKKAHGLDHIELPPWEPLEFQPRAKQGAAPLARLFTEFLSRLGWLGTVTLSLLAFVLQFTGIVAAVIWVAGVVDLVIGGNPNSFNRSNLLIGVGFLVVCLTTGYLGFVVVRRRLALRAPKLSIGVTITVVVTAMVLSWAMFASLV
jgi:hypothetical protein